MNRKLLLIVAMLLPAGGAQGAESSCDLTRLPPGTIVRIAAKRPAITLRRAEVLDNTNNCLTIGHNRDRFVVAESNIIELKILERAPVRLAEDDPSAAGGGASGASATSPGGSSKKGFWQRLAGLWR